MPLKAVVDELDSVDEAHRGLYRQITDEKSKHHGKWVLDVEPVNGFELDDISGLKSALGAERGKRSELEAKLKAFDGIDPKKAREAFERLEALREIDPEKEADKIAEQKFKSLEEQLKAKHQEEVNAVKEQAERYRNHLYKEMVENRALAAIAKADGNTELLMPHVTRHIRLKETDDGFAVEVVDKDGNPRIKDAAGNPMGIDDLVAEMRQSEIFAAAFKGNGKSGTGAPSSTTAAGAAKKRSEMTPAEKGTFIKEHGLKAFLDLPG